MGTFRPRWRSTAEARVRAAGPRRLRGGGAAAAPRPGGPGAAAGPRAPRDAHRGEQLGARSEAPREVQRGAADVLCCSHRGGWMVLHFVLGKVGKSAGKQSTHFQIISEFVIYVEVRQCMNMSILRKSSQIVSNHVMYGRAKTWTCQSLAKMFAKNRCRVASFSLRWLRLSQRFSKKSQNRCTLRLEFICKWKIGTKMTHMQILLNMSTRRTLCFILQVLNYVCIYMVQLDLTSFSSVQTQGRCPPFFPFHIVLAGGSRPGAPHHRRHHPKSPGGGPAPPSSGRARSAPRCESPADLHEQPGDPSGKAGEAG